MSSTTVRKRLTGGWEWTATVRPPERERIVVSGVSITKWTAQRTARRELHRLLAVTR